MISSKGSSMPWQYVTSKIVEDLDYVTGICKVCMTFVNVYVLHMEGNVCPTCEHHGRPTSYLVHADPQIVMEVESRQTASQGPKGGVTCFFALNKPHIAKHQPNRGFMHFGPNCSHVANREGDLSQPWNGSRPTLAKHLKQGKDIPTRNMFRLD
eukprot:819376-Karenia_brevis.AAC.1